MASIIVTVAFLGNGSKDRVLQALNCTLSSTLYPGAPAIESNNRQTTWTPATWIPFPERNFEHSSILGDERWLHLPSPPNTERWRTVITEYGKERICYLAPGESRDDDPGIRTLLELSEYEDISVNIGEESSPPVTGPTLIGAAADNWLPNPQVTTIVRGIASPLILKQWRQQLRLEYGPTVSLEIQTWSSTTWLPYDTTASSDASDKHTLEELGLSKQALAYLKSHSFDSAQEVAEMSERYFHNLDGMFGRLSAEIRNRLATKKLTVSGPDFPLSLRAHPSPMSVLRSTEKLRKTIQQLRAPDGCPWDQAQTHESLRPHLLEESHEALAAIESGKDKAMIDEFGDVLLQVVMHAEIGRQRGGFGWPDIVEAVNSKMIRRHPHVFGDTQIADIKELRTQWARIKAEDYDEPKHPLENLPASLPSLSFATAAAHAMRRAGTPMVHPYSDADMIDALRTANDSDLLGDALLWLASRADAADIDLDLALRDASARLKRAVRTSCAG
jgi:NTP pyrophosphatase (non-canonical NTP hydrolase)